MSKLTVRVVEESYDSTVCVFEHSKADDTVILQSEQITIAESVEELKAALIYLKSLQTDSERDKVLKQCPFCGGEDIDVLEHVYAAGTWYFVICNTCYAEIGEQQTKERAVAIWNTRFIKAPPNNGMESDQKDAGKN